jgi:hypothetical protein
MCVGGRGTHLTVDKSSCRPAAYELYAASVPSASRSCGTKMDIIRLCSAPNGQTENHSFAPLCSIPAGRLRLIATVTDPQDPANFLGKIVCEGEKVYLYPAGCCIEKQVIRGSLGSKAVPGRKWSLQGRHPSLRHLYKSFVSLLRDGRSLRHFLALAPDSRLLVRVGRHCEFCRSTPDN